MPPSGPSIAGMRFTITSDFDALGMPGSYMGGFGTGNPDAIALTNKLQLIAALPIIFKRTLTHIAHKMEEDIKNSIVNQTGGWPTRSDRSHYTKWKKKNYPENEHKALIASGAYMESITAKTIDRGVDNFSIGVTCDPPEYIALAGLLENGGVASDVSMPHKYPNAERAGHKIYMPPRPHWKPVFDENREGFDDYFNAMLHLLANKYGTIGGADKISRAYAGAVKTGSGWADLAGKAISGPPGGSYRTAFKRGGKSIQAFRGAGGRFVSSL